ncbi:MAG: acyl-ACP--UDP-N-acetylglucosamine O-acyltransferase [FCB group bacterium]|nr:acyl-ACP--UDP-N-acetylglucosamine O-acyltransferase [FCB group bacterium]
MIHPTALVDPKAQLGTNVQVGPFSIIEEDTIIGDNSLIAANAVIKSGSRIGNNCRIYQGAVLAEVPQDLKFGGEKTLLEIGDDTTIREYCTLNRGTSAHGKTTIGRECLLMAYVHVGHDCIISDKVILANSISLGGHVEIGYHATIGGHTPIHQFCCVGDHAFVGGAYRVVQDIPPYILATGEPMRYAGINAVGLRRRGFEQETRNHIKRAYRRIYRSGLNITQAIQSIKDELEITPEIQNIISFIEKSDRGIV